MDDAISLGDSYDGYPRIEEAFGQRLDESLDPRGPEALLALVAEFGLPAGSVTIDAGCGEGDDAITLATRFELAVTGIDPVRRHIELAQNSSQDAGLGGRVSFDVGSVERLPVDDATVDLVWCKEVLMYADLDRAFSEFARVMRPRGVGLVYQVLTGPNMSDDEAREFWGDQLGAPAASVRPADIAAAMQRAGLLLQRRVDFGSEWGEYGQEHSGTGGRRLLHAARLLREPDRYVAEFGEKFYRVMLGDCLWHVYRMIGKLHGAAFIFTPTS